MYRVELKGDLRRPKRERSGFQLFLMYCVELKARRRFWRPREYARVPNVPCGVERTEMLRLAVQVIATIWFLMYRVELKVLLERDKLQGQDPVPNVPCGVERTA